MHFELVSFHSGIIQKQAINEVLACNNFTQVFGLALSQAQATELVETRFSSLHKNGRIEFGGGVIDKLIKEFCDSSFISMDNYAQTLHELIELFYYYKNESADLICDDDLVRFMKVQFDGVCQGSLDLLSERELCDLSRKLRFGLSFEWMDGREDEDE